MDMETRTQDRRRHRLSLWLEKNGGPRAACEAAGAARSVESRISNILHGEVFGSRGARSLERKLLIPEGYLDGESDTPEGEAPRLPQQLDQPPKPRVTPPHSHASKLSHQAADLAELLDLIPDRIARSEVYSHCSQIIIAALKSDAA
jgi:hypothetical protein